MYYTSLGKSYKNKSGKVLKVLEQIIEDADVALLKFDDGTERRYRLNLGLSILISTEPDELDSEHEILVQV